MWYPDIHDIPNFDFQLGFKHRVLYTKVEIWVTSHGLMKNRGIQCLLTLPDPFVWANYSCYLIIIHKLEIRLPNLNILNKLKKTTYSWFRSISLKVLHNINIDQHICSSPTCLYPSSWFRFGTFTNVIRTEIALTIFLELLEVSGGLLQDGT